MRPVDELQLVRAPVGALGALVLAVADHRRLGRERVARIARVEDELDHLPVALVQVVPVVVGVEQPVLQRKLPRVLRIGRDVRVHRGLVSLHDATRPALVVAARVERVAGKVEVVLVEALREILGRRRDLDQVVRIPRSAERNRRLSEQRVDVHRLVGLAGSALLLLLDEPHDRGVALGERLLVCEARRRGRREAERGKGEEQEGRRAKRPDQDFPPLKPRARRRRDPIPAAATGMRRSTVL
jgi:hypothetical protein